MGCHRSGIYSYLNNNRSRVRYRIVKNIFLLFFIVNLSTLLHSQNDSATAHAAIPDSTCITGFVPFSDSLMEYAEYGIASWYGAKWNGRMCSSGQQFCPDSLTAAHKRLPFGTVVRVTNLSNDSVCYVKITDRLPKSSKRCIDLAPCVAKKLNFYSKGLTRVKIEVVGEAPIYKREVRR